jgi:hypothetical protein
MNDLQLYAAPRVPAELREQVDRLLAGPVRYAGAAGSDDPGFVLAPGPIAYHPNAERVAVELRAARTQQVDRQTIGDWLESVSYSVANPPQSKHEFAMRVSAVAQVCAEFALPVWQDAIGEALRTFKFWPSGPEIYDLLKRHDERQLARLSEYDRIARGAREPVGRAREATGYDPGPATPQHAPHPSMPRHDPASDLVRIDQQSRDAQIAAFGGIGETDLLAARRKAFGQ